MHLAFHFSRNTWAACIDPVADLAKTCVETYRKSVLARDLHSVVLSWIVRRCDLDRRLESIVSSAEIHHRCCAESCIIYVCAGICDSFKKILMDLRR